MKAFRMGAYQIYCQPNRTFTRQDTLAVAFQLHNLAGNIADAGEIKIEFLKDGQPFRTIARKPSDYAGLPDILEQVPLADFIPAHYTVRVSLAMAGAEIVSAAEEFDLSFAEALPRPWFSSRILPAAGDPVYEEIMGSQLFRLGRLDEARGFLESALRKRPESEVTAANLARVSLAQDDAPAAAKVLAPFVAPAKTPLYETLVLAAEASRAAEDHARSVELLDRAVARFGVNAALMNAMGESYEGMGKTKEALTAYERSLQLSPDQPRIKQRVEELRKKIPR